MKRTIDSIDYIAKSEVLRIIDDEMLHAHELRQKYADDPGYYLGWDSRYYALKELRALIANPEER